MIGCHHNNNYSCHWYVLHVFLLLMNNCILLDYVTTHDHPTHTNATQGWFCLFYLHSGHLPCHNHSHQLSDDKGCHCHHHNHPYSYPPQHFIWCSSEFFFIISFFPFIPNISILLIKRLHSQWCEETPLFQAGNCGSLWNSLLSKLPFQCLICEITQDFKVCMGTNRAMTKGTTTTTTNTHIHHNMSSHDSLVCFLFVFYIFFLS